MAKKKPNKQSEAVSRAKEEDVMFNLLDSKVEIPLGLLRQKHIFIATPCYGGQIGEPYFRTMSFNCFFCF